MNSLPRVSFGMIVLNGEPFTRYNLRALYPFAHEIIVVEGAVEKARDIATPDGHARDGTLEVLRRFKAEEDPENKVQIITRDGFWKDLVEQSQAYATRATGDLLWQVDSDEFYHPDDMRAVLEMLQRRPDITEVCFQQIFFWGSFDTITDGWYLHLPGPRNFRRVFRWGPEYRYVEHESPTVLDPQGRDLYRLRPARGPEMAQQGIYLYHYSLVFPKQARDKSAYYQHRGWIHSRRAMEWAERGFMRLEWPFHVHNVYRYPSWLERFRGQHPPIIQRLRADLDAGEIAIELRPTGDIERLLNSPRYRLGRAALRPLSGLFVQWRYLRHQGKREW